MQQGARVFMEKKYHFHFCAVIAITIFWPISALAQTKEHIYHQNVVASLMGGSRPENISFYFMTLAREINGGRSLAELPPEIRDAVGQILEPVTNSVNRRFSYSEGSDEINTIDQETRLLEGEAIDQLFKLLGPVLIMQASNEYATSQIESLVEVKGVSGLVSLFDRAIKKPHGLGLTVDQVDRIQKIKEGLLTQQGELDSRYLNRLRMATRELWPRLLQALDKEQEQEAEQLLGKQAEWFRFIEQPKSMNVNSNSIGVLFAGTRVSEKYKQNLLQILEVPEQELESQKIEVIDPLMFQLVSYSFVEDELDLNGEQRKKLKDLRETDWRERGLSYLKHSDDRFDLLLSQKAPLPAGLIDILLPRQQLWLLQIELQLRTGFQYRSTAGLTHPKLIRHLALSSGQVTNLKRIGDEYLEEWNPVFEDYKTERKLLQKKVLDEIRQTMSEPVNGDN
jgi:hypothetical protein